MKKILLASAVTALTVNSAFAESNRQPKGIITEIDPQYEIVYKFLFTGKDKLPQEILLLALLSVVQLAINLVTAVARMQ